MNEQPGGSPTGPAPGWQFYRHMPVYMSNRRRLGRAEEIDHAVDYIHVQQGHLFIRDWYVPIAAVCGVTDQGIFLSISREDLIRRRMNVPPEDYLAHQGATAGYEYTCRSDIPPYGEHTTETDS